VALGIAHQHEHAPILPLKAGSEPGADGQSVAQRARGEVHARQSALRMHAEQRAVAAVRVARAAAGSTPRSASAAYIARTALPLRENEAVTGRVVGRPESQHRGT